MKRVVSVLLALAVLLSLAACGKQSETPTQPTQAASEKPQDETLEIRINADNFDDYFVYKEYVSTVKWDDGRVSSASVAYGFALREGYTADQENAKKNSLQIRFTAVGVVNYGSYTVDFDTLQYSGTTYSTERVPVAASLQFWPKGDRSTVWTYGNYGASYILYLENFTVTEVSGTVYLRPAEAA